MTTAELEHFHRRAQAAACAMGFHKEKEDIAQQVLANFLDGKNQHSTIGQAAIDGVRQLIGDLRSRDNNLERKKAIRFAIELSSELEGHIADPNAASLDDKIDFEFFIDKLQKSELRAFSMLRYKWGFSMKEIGHVFNVSESRVSQRITEIEAYLRKKFKERDGERF